jgi:putative endonuclease
MSHPDHRRALGNKGEQLAADYFTKMGYTVVERNWHCGKMGELDLIVRKGREIRIVEVKARAESDDGYPEDAVTDSKLARIADLAEIYLVQNGLKGDVHVDVIAIRYRTNTEPEIVWLKDV